MDEIDIWHLKFLRMYLGQVINIQEHKDWERKHFWSTIDTEKRVQFQHQKHSCQKKTLQPDKGWINAMIWLAFAVNADPSQIRVD